MRRLPWLILPVSFVLVTLLAAWLHPSASGLGTHQALGLPPCPFYHLTGFPCPACGLTTSWTHWVHGHFLLAFKVHPLGPLFFILYALASGLSLLEFLGRPTGISRFLTGQGTGWVVFGLSLFIGTWIARLLGTWGNNP